MVEEVVVMAWRVRKDDRKALASGAREPFGISLAFVSRGDVEGNVEEDAWTWGVRKDDRKPGVSSATFFDFLGKA